MIKHFNCSFTPEFDLFYKYLQPLASRTFQENTMNQIRTIRWILDHEPIDLFIRTAKAFDEHIRKLTNNTVQVEIYTSAEFSQKFATQDTNTINPLVLVNTAQAEVTQVETKWIGLWYNPDFFALEMPYLFRDHDHATRVLDGKIGRQLLDQVEQNSQTKALSFTYSGGYRVFTSDQPLMTAEDLKGLTCITSLNPVRVDTARALGCNVLPVDTADMETKGRVTETSGTIETTLPRYEAEAYQYGCRHIGETDHSMFLTSILVNKDFYNSLTLDQQAAMQQAASYVSQLERQWTVDEGKQIAADVEMHKQKGIKFHRFADEEIEKLKDMVKPVYDKYETVFGHNLIKDIKST
jgi:TRAP-type C4-dicarboxylate transport system substrate-binding protein